jgi:hypothetical protein
MVVIISETGRRISPHYLQRKPTFRETDLRLSAPTRIPWDSLERLGGYRGVPRHSSHQGQQLGLMLAARAAPFIPIYLSGGAFWRPSGNDSGPMRGVTLNFRDVSTKS